MAQLALCNAASQQCGRFRSEADTSERFAERIYEYASYEQLGIIHLATGTREGFWSLIDMTGRLHQRPLTFPHYDSFKVQHDAQCGVAAVRGARAGG